MFSTKTLVWMTSLVLAVNSQFIRNADCDWEPPHRSNIHECQNTITKALYDDIGVKTGHMGVWPNQCTVAGRDERGCVLQVCSRNAHVQFIPWRNVAVAGQVIHSSCRADFDEGTAGTVDAVGISDTDNSARFFITMGRSGTLGFDVKRSVNGTVGDDDEVIEESAAHSSASRHLRRLRATSPLKARQQQPIRWRIREGLEFELVTEEGQRSLVINENLAERMEDAFNDNMRTRDVAELSEIREAEGIEYSLFFGGDTQTTTQEIHPHDRFNVIEGLHNFWRDRGFPALFAVRLWTGDSLVLGWFIWQIRNI